MGKELFIAVLRVVGIIRREQRRRRLGVGPEECCMWRWPMEGEMVMEGGHGGWGIRVACVRPSSDASWVAAL